MSFHFKNSSAKSSESSAGKIVIQHLCRQSSCWRLSKEAVDHPSHSSLKTDVCQLVNLCRMLPNRTGDKKVYKRNLWPCVRINCEVMFGSAVHTKTVLDHTRGVTLWNDCGSAAVMFTLCIVVMATAALGSTVNKDFSRSPTLSPGPFCKRLPHLFQIISLNDFGTPLSN